MIIANPFDNINAMVHRFCAHIILEQEKKGINVFRFTKKRLGILDGKYDNKEFCDAETANKLLQTSGINVIVLNSNKEVIGRNWIK